MAKYLMLTADPKVRWELPDEIDLQDRSSLLYDVLANGRKSERAGYVVTVPVLVDGQETALYLRESDLTCFALVEIPDPVPLVG